MAVFRGRELTEEEAFEADKRQQAEPSGLQRASTLEAIKRLVAAGPQAEPAPPPEPVSVPPMLERPAGAIPAALLRPSGEVVHPRDQALISRWSQFRRGGAAPRAAAPKTTGAEIPEMLRRLPEPRVPRTAEGMVLEKFGGDMGAYDKWWRSLPQSMRPRSWNQALGMVSSPEALGVPKAAAPKEVAPKPVAHGELEQIKADEGWRSKVYKDTEGIKTIGYGFNLERPDAAAALKSVGISKTVDELKSGKATLTTEEGTKLIEAEIPHFEAAAQQFIGKETWDKLAPDKQQVLTNMAFNLGSTRLQGFAKLKKAVQGEDWAAAQAEMKDSNWYRQVGKRADRLIERMGSPSEGATQPRPTRQERIDAHMATVPEVKQVPSRQDRIDAYMATAPEVREVTHGGEVPGGAVEGIRLFNGSRDDGQGLLHPISGDVFRASSSGMRMHPVHKEDRQHKGDDYAPLSKGENLPLVAMMDGKVTYAKDKFQKPVSTGNRIEIEYGQGNNRFKVRYFHMKDVPKLKKDDPVKRGSTVGLMGNTGIGSGVHLHAELRRYNPKTKDFELHDFDKFLESGGKGSLSDTAYDTKRRSIAGHRPGHAADHPGHSTQDEVLEKFGGKMLGKGSYNEWYESLPESKRPGGWKAALKMLKKA